MRRTFFCRAVLTAATQFASHLKLLALEAASSQEAAAVRRTAKEFVQATDVENGSINLTSCVDTLQVCADLDIAPQERVVQVMSLWLTENVTSLDGQQWCALSEATSRTRWEFWDETLFNPNEALVRARLPLLDVADALRVARRLRDVSPEGHYTLRCLFESTAAANLSTDQIMSLVEVYAPLMSFRPGLVQLVTKAILGAIELPVFVSVALAALNGGITDDCTLDAVKSKLLFFGPTISTDEVSAILKAMACGAMPVDETVVEVCRRTMDRCKTPSHYSSLAEAIAYFPRSENTEKLLVSLQHRIEVLLPDTISDKCKLAKCAACCGATRAFQEIMQSVLREKDIPATVISDLLEGSVITDVYPTGMQLSRLLGCLEAQRDTLPLNDLAVAVFAAGASGASKSQTVMSLISAASGRIWLSRSHDPGITPQTVALLLRGCHLLGVAEDVKVFEALHQKADEMRAGFSISDCCHLLLVTRGIGGGANQLTMALASQIRLSIPVVEPALISVVAKAFALCRIRDVSAFRALADRATACAEILTETCIVDILEAFETAEMEDTLGSPCIEAFLGATTKKPADQRNSELEAELALWATKFDINATFEAPASLPTTIKGAVDRLAMQPTAASLELFVQLSESVSAQDLSAQCKVKRLVNAMLRVAEATLDDAMCKTALHRLCLAAALAVPHELDRHLGDMVLCLKHVSSRRMNVGAVFRVFGKRLCAGANQLTAAQVIDVAEAYIVMRVPDDAVIRALMMRLNELEPSMKSSTLRIRASAARQAFGHWGRKV